MLTAQQHGGGTQCPQPGARTHARRKLPLRRRSRVAHRAPDYRGPGTHRGVTGYVQAEVRSKLIDLLGYEQTTGGGYRVFTTVDSELQTVAEKALRDQLSRVELETPNYKHETPAKYKERLQAFLSTGKTIDDKDCPRPTYLQGAVIMTDSQTGAILSMVGGRDFSHSQYNRAIQGRRPAGTAFTPFVFGAAFENGAYPGTKVKDTPLDNTRVMISAITGILGEWGSEDTETNYAGDINARRALVMSRNGATVRLGSEVGLTEIAGIRPARRHPVGPQKRKQNVPRQQRGHPGRNGARLLHIRRPGAAAEATLPDHQDRGPHRPRDLRIPGRRRRSGPGDRRIHRLSSAQLPAPGRFAKARAPPPPPNTDSAKSPPPGKSGTHANFTDTWFVGYTSRMTCAVWVGLDKPGMIFENAFSNRLALPVWATVIKAAETGYPSDPPQPPPGGEELEVCTRSGLRATYRCYRPPP